MAGIKDAIRQADDIQIERDVEIPEWDCTVDVYGLPSGDWEAYQNELSKLRLQKTQGKDGFELNVRSRRALIVAKCLHDPETGDLVFPDLQEGISILSKKSAGTVTGLFMLCQKLSGEDRDFTQKVKDAEGNSNGDPS
jgi:hypothetical protein